MKNFNTMKKENEHDIRNGPVRVYVANGKKSFVPKLEPAYRQVSVEVEMPAEMNAVMEKIDAARLRRHKELQAELVKIGFGL